MGVAWQDILWNLIKMFFLCLSTDHIRSWWTIEMVCYIQHRGLTVGATLCPVKARNFSSFFLERKTAIMFNVCQLGTMQLKSQPWTLGGALCHEVFHDGMIPLSSTLSTLPLGLPGRFRSRKGQTNPQTMGLNQCTLLIQYAHMPDNGGDTVSM